MRKRIGFTLIELLIVVAIIAILAAIAVPNFLEAQVRSKIARVKNDQRTLATAFESYAVDNNRPPLDFAEYLNLVTRPNGMPDWMRCFCYNCLTTPIAYITSPMRDPFMEMMMVTTNRELPEMRYYHYQYFGPPFPWAGAQEVLKRGFTWCIYSVGPKVADGAPWPDYYLQEGVPADVALSMTYDASNGTKSFGRIHRTNKGILEGGQL
jgi:prepilin-type N-terminal cleavage/methylation domain-containing protein